MRKIKFKIWADNQFYYKCLVGNTNDTNNDNWTCPMVWLEDKKEWVNCDNGIICEYTGLKDKNGVEIYEGDILRTRHKNKLGMPNGGHYKTVKWNDIINGFNIRGNQEKWEVIGNIYENPDLVGGELC